MSSETRVIRPFDVAVSLEKVFEGTRLRFGDLECEPGSSIIVEDAAAYAIRKVELVLAEELHFEELKRTLGTGAGDSGLSPSLLSLLVTASTSYLKITDVVWQHSLDYLETLPRIVDLAYPHRPRALQASTSGATVDLYLIRTKGRDPKPLHPWRKGTWLARTGFRIRTHHEISLFRPTRLDDETRSKLGLPAKTMRYVHMGDHVPTEPYENTEPPVFYVDEVLLSELAARGASPASAAMQMQLVLDFVTAVVTASTGQIDGSHTYRDLEDSLIGRVVRLITGSSARDSTRDAMIRMIRTDPAMVIAHAEHAIDLGKTMLASIKEGDK